MARSTNIGISILESRLKKWSNHLKLERSANGDSIIASAKSIDVTSEDLRKLADVVDEGDWTVRLGRSGANFRMIIY